MFLAGAKYSLEYNSIISSHEIQSSRSISKADKTAVRQLNSPLPRFPCVPGHRLTKYSIRKYYNSDHNTEYTVILTNEMHC